MILRDELSALTPRLRRYARALATGSPLASEFADDLVQATLTRALGARFTGGTKDLAIRLYATITQIHRESLAFGTSVAVGDSARTASMGGHPVALAGPGTRSKLSAGLLSLTLEDREALLLVALEGFDYAEAARILRVSRTVFLTRLTRARRALDEYLRSRPTTRGRTHDVPYLRVVK